MIDIKKIRDEFDAVVAAEARRGVDKAKIENARDLDTKRRALVAETESLKAKRNAASKEIGKIAKEGGDIAAAKEEMRKVGDRIAEIDKELAQVDHDLREALLMIPNLLALLIPLYAAKGASLCAGAATYAFVVVYHAKEICPKVFGRPREFLLHP